MSGFINQLLLIYKKLSLALISKPRKFMNTIKTFELRRFLFYFIDFILFYFIYLNFGLFIYLFLLIYLSIDLLSINLSLFIDLFCVCVRKLLHATVTRKFNSYHLNKLHISHLPGTSPHRPSDLPTSEGKGSAGCAGVIYLSLGQNLYSYSLPTTRILSKGHFFVIYVAESLLNSLGSLSHP